MTRRTVEAGGVSVLLELNGDKLRSLTLPAEVPDTFDAAALWSVLGELSEFTLDLEGTPPFCRLVWERMREIPPGTALTYAELASAVGNSKAMRAVGQACGANRLPLIIPCHRVLAESGIGGFALGLGWKQRLLELETEFPLN